MTTAIQEYSKTDAALAELASRYKSAVFDVTTTKGMQDAKTARAELRGYRVDLEKTRVEIKAPALERCRLIDAEAKRITSALVELEDPIDTQIKNEERRREAEAMEKAMAEQRRKDGIATKIDAIRQRAPVASGWTSEAISRAIADLEALPIAEEFMEFAADAQTAKDAALLRLREMRDAALGHEAELARVRAEREELARLRAEAEARDRARLEEERASRARIEAEERASRERIEAEERQARVARAAEEARIAAERAQVDATRRAAEEAARKEREAAEAKQREIQRRENEVMDARAMLDVFKKRFGHLPDFAGVVQAIDALTPKKRKAA